MQQGAQNSPIVVRESWLTRGLVLVIVMFAGIGFALPGPDGLWARNPSLCAVLIGGGLVLGVWHLLRPARLEIWPDELVWVSAVGLKHRYPLAEVDEFAMKRLSRAGPVVVFNWCQDSPRRTRLDKITEAVNGYDVMIGGSWQMSCQDLVDLLNRSLLRPSAWR